MSKTILSMIESHMSSYSKGQKRIGKYILENYDKAAFLTASKLGKLTNVSESTVVRFSYALHYDGYPSMQRALQELVRSRLTATQRIQEAGDRFAGQNLMTAVMHSDLEKLRMTIENMDHADFDRAVEKLVNARNIYIIGVRSSYYLAGYLSFYLSILMDKVSLVRSDAGGAIYEKLFRIGPGDVLLAISYPRYSPVTLHAVHFAVDQGAEVIGITDSKASPLYRDSSISLFARSEMLSFVDSMVAPMSLINALLVSVARRIGTDVSRTFGELEDIWDRYNVFDKSEDE